MKRRKKRLRRATVLDVAARQTDGPRRERYITGAIRYRRAADFADWDEYTETDPSWCGPKGRGWHDPDEPTPDEDTLEVLVSDAQRAKP
ncbi:MAG: hypothetical protein H6707_12260 [Deltaproteobacteria bacterium]|nr:hypothetical protein [Deltaproteobacteria bacterium]